MSLTKKPNQRGEKDCNASVIRNIRVMIKPPRPSEESRIFIEFKLDAVVLATAGTPNTDRFFSFLFLRFLICSAAMGKSYPVTPGLLYPYPNTDFRCPQYPTNPHHRSFFLPKQVDSSVPTHPMSSKAISSFGKPVTFKVVEQIEGVSNLFLTYSVNPTASTGLSRSKEEKKIDKARSIIAGPSSSRSSKISSRRRGEENNQGEGGYPGIIWVARLRVQFGGGVVKW
ncbi:unnamed protein product [Microthlaspi erraticum]|uniref:Uncharacterized protein n=1 Tax=Microthlaspi erraticum TaxID=1685480 RepID=A0A6D2IEA4_9BRAS|nr:unnamed protein product [Microthlaspi erraticum]CAA7028446.1 unnamed protein product [Microthlaspi erraticum]